MEQTRLVSKTSAVAHVLKPCAKSRWLDPVTLAVNVLTLCTKTCTWYQNKKSEESNKIVINYILCSTPTTNSLTHPKINSPGIIKPVGSEQTLYSFWKRCQGSNIHYSDNITGAMVSQIMSLTIAYSTVYSGADQRKHQSSAPLAFVWGIHRWTVNSPHKRPVTRRMFPYDDVIMSKKEQTSINGRGLEWPWW